MERSDVTDQQCSLGCAELKVPCQWKVCVPTPSAQQAQTVAGILQGEREGSLAAGLARGTVKDLDELDALVVGQLSSAGADVASRLEQPVVTEANKAATDSQVYFALGVFGQVGARRLGYSVMTEAVVGIATDRVGDPAAAAVDGLDES
jgi:hypothetical protein